MSRPVKGKAQDRKPANNRNKKLFSKPQKVVAGTILTDGTKKQWLIGAPIGTGGFGDIYSASRVGENKYDFVVKCEPHSNGPLFVEMHFYMRNAKYDDIEKFKALRGLKTLGMPYMLGSGSVDLNSQKHRFIVMPRFECDIVKFYKANGDKLPEGAIYRLSIQMLDVYEFIHHCGYVHADLKAANILLGRGKSGAAQAYLVDFGLASHYTTKEFKPDPKKMHNGTIEYTSRDAHQGVATRRGDFEILAYNLIDWWGVTLPWVREKLLAVPANVEKSKIKFWENINSELKPLPAAISAFVKYVAKMKYNDIPDYDHCRELFVEGLQKLKLPRIGEIEFLAKNLVRTPRAEATTTKAVKERTKRTPQVVSPASPIVPNKTSRVAKPGASSSGKANRRRCVIDTSDEEISERDDSDSDYHESERKKKKTASAAKSPHKRKVRQVRSPETPPAVKRLKTDKQKNSPDSDRRNTGLMSSTPTSAVSVSMSSTRPGRTIINDNVTPTADNKKTYEFNFELDVSLDANVIVNVKRKKKAPTAASVTVSSSSRRANQVSDADGTPVSRVKMRRVDPNGSSLSLSNGQPSPNVTIRKTRRP